MHKTALLTCLKVEVLTTPIKTTMLSTTISTTTSTTTVSSTTMTSVAVQASKSVVRDDRRTCADPPAVSNGRWLCNSNFYSNGVICTNQCFDGFGFDRKDFFRQEISCKCIIDNAGQNECRWIQRSRVIKEASEFLPEFWQHVKLPECMPNDDSQKCKSKIHCKFNIELIGESFYMK